MIKLFKEAFKRRHPYAPVAYMGRKNFEKTMDCKVLKLKELDKRMAQEAKS